MDDAKFDFSIVFQKVDEHRLHYALDFHHPEYISQGDGGFDTLEVRINQEALQELLRFKNSEDQEVALNFDESLLAYEFNLPQMLPKEESIRQTVKNQQEVIQAQATISLQVFIVQLLLNQSLGKFLSMANFMQILAFMTLINLKIPPTTTALLINIRNIVTFDISLVGQLFDRDYHEHLLEWMFQGELGKDVLMSPEFEAAEMDTEYSLKALFTNIIILLLFLFSRALYYGMTKLNLPCLVARRKQITQDKLETTSSQLILYLVETSLDIITTCSIELILKDTSAKRHFAALFSYYLSLFLMLCVFFLIAWPVRFVKNNYVKIGNPEAFKEFHRRYDSLWDGQRIFLSNSLIPLFTTAFMLRRLAYGLLLTTYP